MTPEVPANAVGPALAGPVGALPGLLVARVGEGSGLAGLAAAAGVDVFRRAARSENTLAAYRKDWARFSTWCGRAGVMALPAGPGVVATYLADAASQPTATGWRYSPSTLARWLATINKAHDLAEHRPPGRDADVADTLAGIRRTRAQPPNRKAPILLEDLEAIVAAVPVGEWPAAPGGIRNRMILVMGWVGAFRRSELAELTLGDVTLHPQDGLHVRLRKSKTDPGSQGLTYALPYATRPGLCAPCWFLRWRTVLAGWEGLGGMPGGRAGVMRATLRVAPARHVCRTPSYRKPPDNLDPASPLLRSVRANGTLGGPITGRVVAEVIKRSADAAGYDPAILSGHSLRSGFVTQAFRNGADAHAIMRQTGHRDPKMLELYAREAAPLIGNAVTILDL